MASGKQPYVRFDRSAYSIPHDRIRQPLTLIASEAEIRIADGVTELARHASSYEAGVVIEDPAHLEKLTAEKRRASSCAAATGCAVPARPPRSSSTR